MVVLTAMVLYALFAIRTVLAPFVYALAIVYVLRPLVGVFEGRGVNRLAAIALSYLIVIVGLAIVGLYFVPMLLDQSKQFLDNLPRYVANVSSIASEYRGRVERFPIPPGFSRLMEQLIENVRQYLLGFLSGIPLGAMNVVGTVFNLVLAPIIAFYILKDLPQIMDGATGLVPARFRDETRAVLRKVDQVLGGFLKGQTLVALSVGLLCSIALAVVGLPYPVAIGMLAGILNIVPYLGPIVGGSVVFIVGLFTSWKLAILGVVTMVVVQQLDGLLISPNIMSQQVKLHPALVIFSLLVGGSFFGLSGMILAIPAAATMKALLMHWLEKAEGGEATVGDAQAVLGTEEQAT